jgi:hypothetical protein
MSIAAANLFTRNIFKEFFKPDASPALETRVVQWISLLVKIGALVFVLALSKTFSINLPGQRLTVRAAAAPRAAADRMERSVLPTGNVPP